LTPECFVAFDPCGWLEPGVHGPAPNFVDILLRADAIIGLSRSTAKGGPCTYLLLYEELRLVQGTAEMLLERIVSAMPHC